MVIKEKKGQFFILAAIIIVSAVIGLAVVKNYVSIGESSNSVDKYSQEIGQESGSTVDYALYNGQSNSYLGSFFNESIENILNTNPDMEVYACYGNKTNLNCENWGINDISISVDNGAVYFLEGGRKKITNGLCAESCETSEVENRIQNPDSVRESFSSVGVNNITFSGADFSYTLDLTRAAQSNQFYLLFKQNSTGGVNVATTNPLQ